MFICRNLFHGRTLDTNLKLWENYRVINNRSCRNSEKIGKKILTGFHNRFQNINQNEKEPWKIYVVMEAFCFVISITDLSRPTLERMMMMMMMMKFGIFLELLNLLVFSY
jgi:hypothetical protein